MITRSEKDDRRARCRALIAQLTCLRLSADTNACSDGLVFALQVKSRIDPQSIALSKLIFFAVGRSIGDRIVRMLVTAYPPYAVTTSVLLVNV